MRHQFFPRGIAFDHSFCNRHQERAELSNRILAGEHTWLSAPRRYGKTSLLHQTLKDLEQARLKRDRASGVIIDLLTAYDAADVARIFAQGVGQVMASLLPTQKRLLQAVRDRFGRLDVRLVISSDGLPHLELGSSQPAQESIRDLLLGLERVAQAEGRRVVLAVDEFQSLVHIDGHASLEASIRHAVERSRLVSYCFSGSHRGLLMQLFTSPDRPLYRLCSPMEVERISTGAYAAHLQQCASLHWSATLPEVAIERIMDLSRRHPYYVNLLCHRLWQREQLPDEIVVDRAWQALCQELRSALSIQLDLLSHHQFGTLKALVRYPTDRPTGKDFVRDSGISKATIAQALKVLEQRDFVYRDEGGIYQIMDPAIEQILRPGRKSQTPGEGLDSEHQ